MAWAARWLDRTEAKVATANTNVPAAVPNDDTLTQSITRRYYGSATGLPPGAHRRLRPGRDDGGPTRPYPAEMGQRPRTGVVLSALGIGMFQVIGSFGASHNQPERKSLDVIALLLILVGPAALAWRDRWPLPAVALATIAADVYIGLGYAYGPIFLSVAVALYAAVVAGNRHSTWLLAAMGYLGYLGAALVDPRAARLGLADVGLFAVWPALVLAVAEVVRTRRIQADEAARAELEEKQRRAGEQRLQLAQELHDVLAHNISLINVQAGVALHLIDQEPERVGPALASIKEASREALRELRTALDLLRRGEVAPRGPAPRLSDLDSLVAGVRASGLRVELVQADSPLSLPVAVELATYRIVQEAMTNVTRHAGARCVTVHISFDDGVDVRVTDDGVGGLAEPGNGIAGMHERAAALGGSVEAGPCPGGGFRVVAHLPIGAP